MNGNKSGENLSFHILMPMVDDKSSCPALSGRPNSIADSRAICKRPNDSRTVNKDCLLFTSILLLIDEIHQIVDNSSARTNKNSSNKSSLQPSGSHGISGILTCLSLALATLGSFRTSLQPLLSKMDHERGAIRWSFFNEHRRRLITAASTHFRLCRMRSNE